MSTSRQLPEVQARALDVLDRLVRDGEHVSALTELVAIPSVTGTAAEGEAQHWVSRRCERFGLEVDLWSMDLAELRAMPDFPGAEAPRDEAWGLVAQTPLKGAEDSRRTLVLQGHVDVVPPGDPDAWQGSDPFTPRVIDGVLHGRGACDMKAGVVANLLTVQALHDAGLEPTARLALHSVVGEEDGGLGAFGTLQRGYRGDACVITEPTSRAVITANGGALTFTLTVRGEAAHGSTRYFGVSALEKFAVVHDALRDLEAERNESVDPLMVEYPIAYPLMVGRIEAGDWSSTVPDRLVAEGRYGVILGERVDDAQQVFEQRVLEACAGDPWLSDHPVRVEWTGGRFAPGRISAGHPFVRQVQDAYATATGAGLPREHGAPYGSDLRLYNAAGVPALHLGPGEVRYAHSPREQVRLAEIADVARALVLLALTFEGSDTA